MSGQAVSRCPGLLEVVGDNGAHYRAFLVDIYDPDDPCILNNVPPTAEASDQVTVTVRFEKDWCPNRVLPLSRIRLPPTTGKNDGKAVNGDENLAIKEGDQVEILSPAKDNEGEGWWKSRVYMVKGRLIMDSRLSTASLIDLDFQAISLSFRTLPSHPTISFTIRTTAKSSPKTRFGRLIPIHISLRIHFISL